MPIYVYKNLSTGETFEVEQRITASALTEHPETGEPVKRLIQPVGIAFKGSGFYVTDSRGSSPAKGADSTSKSGGDGGDSGKKSESTPQSDGGSQGSKGSSASSESSSKSA